MKIADVVSVRLINLTDAFGFNRLLNCLTIDFGIESEFYGVYEVLVEFGEVYVIAVFFHSFLYMRKNLLIGYKTKVIFVHNIDSPIKSSISLSVL